jgi:hypothetical protein
MVRMNLDDTMKKVALTELRSIAEVSEVTLTKRILLVRPTPTAKQDKILRLIEALKPDYDDIQLEA